MVNWNGKYCLRIIEDLKIESDTKDGERHHLVAWEDRAPISPSSLSEVSLYLCEIIDFIYHKPISMSNLTSNVFHMAFLHPQNQKNINAFCCFDPLVRIKIVLVFVFNSINHDPN